MSVDFLCSALYFEPLDLPAAVIGDRDLASLCIVSQATFDSLRSSAAESNDCEPEFVIRIANDGRSKGVVVSLIVCDAYFKSKSTLIDSNLPEIMLPPKVLLALHLTRCRLQRTSVALIVTAAAKGRLHKALVVSISQIKGCIYPGEEIEIRALKRYFSSKRVVEVGDVISVPLLPLDGGCMSVADSKLSCIKVHSYCVSSVTVRSAEGKLCDALAYRSEPGESGLVVVPAMKRRLPDAAAAHQLAVLEMRAFLRRQLWQAMEPLGAINAVLATKNIAMPSSASDDSKIVAVRCREYEPDPNMVTLRGACAGKAEAAFERDVSALCCALLPAVEAAALGHSRQQLELMALPLMIETPLPPDDVFQMVLAGVKTLGLRMLVADASLLLPFVAENSKFHGLDVLCSPGGDRVSYLSRLSAPQVLGSAPAVVLLDNLDALVEVLLERSLSAEDSKSADPLEDLASMLAAFLEELWLACRRGAADSAARCDDSLVLFLAYSANPSRLGAKIRAAFPSQLQLMQLDWVADESCLLSQREQQGSEVISAAAFSRLVEEASALGGGPRALLREAEQALLLDLLRRRAGEQWLANAGLVAPVPELMCDDASLAETLRNRCSMLRPQQVTEDDVLRAERSRVFIPKKEFDASGKIRPTHWGDVGGLEEVKRQVVEVLALPFLHPHLFPPSMPLRRGVLLYGPPGTGKTLVARAIATECAMAFMSVKGPELLDAYVGESESNIREVFARAKASHPCVLFFDELDSLAPARGKGGDGGGVLDRVVSQLLTELDLLHDHAAGAAAGIAHGRANGVFFVGATNRPDLLDPSLLRRGRLDVKMYLPPCRGPDDSVKILSAQTRAFVLSEDVDLRAVAESLPAHVTGADVSAASSGAYTIALRRKIEEIGEEYRRSSKCCEYGSIDESRFLCRYIEGLHEDHTRIVVQQQDLLAAARAVCPSVSADMLRHYEALQKTFSAEAIL